jgi:hypothetical protein
MPETLNLHFACDNFRLFGLAERFTLEGLAIRVRYCLLRWWHYPGSRKIKAGENGLPNPCRIHFGRALPL